MVDQMEYLFLFVSDPAATHLTDGAAVRTLADYDVYRVPGMAASVPAGAPAVTEALQAAIDDAATRADVAALRVPAGIYVTGPLCLPSGTRLHLDPGAVLLGSDRPDQWPSIDELTGVSRLAGRRAFVVVNGATDVAISGHGVIDANGVSMAAQGVASRLLLSYR
jgi:polygalacturonase